MEVVVVLAGSQLLGVFNDMEKAMMVAAEHKKEHRQSCRLIRVELGVVQKSQPTETLL